MGVWLTDVYVGRTILGRDRSAEVDLQASIQQFVKAATFITEAMLCTTARLR